MESIRAVNFVFTPTQYIQNLQRDTSKPCRNQKMYYKHLFQLPSKLLSPSDVIHVINKEIMPEHACHGQTKFNILVHPRTQRVPTPDTLHGKQF